MANFALEVIAFENSMLHNYFSTIFAFLKGMIRKMDGKYTFERFYDELEQGYQIFYTYVRNRYVLFKTSENCYTQKLLTIHEKNPHPIMEMLTKKRIREMFPFMENIEYKVREE